MRVIATFAGFRGHAHEARGHDLSWPPAKGRGSPLRVWRPRGARCRPVSSRSRGGPSRC